MPSSLSWTACRLLLAACCLLRAACCVLRAACCPRAPQDEVDAASAPVNQARHLRQAKDTCTPQQERWKRYSTPLRCARGAVGGSTSSPCCIVSCKKHCQTKRLQPMLEGQPNSALLRSQLTAPVCRDRWNARSMPCRCANTLLATLRMAPCVTCGAAGAGAAVLCVSAGRRAGIRWRKNKLVGRPTNGTLRDLRGSRSS